MQLLEAVDLDYIRYSYSNIVTPSIYLSDSKFLIPSNFTSKHATEEDMTV